MNQLEFKNACTELGIFLSEEQLQQFDTYFHLLVEWNKVMNLTGITEEGEVYEKHFYDSLLIKQLVDMKGSLCDVGSGAGFPGIPCKIAFPELSLTIIEPLGKRCKFLQAVVDELGLKKVWILNERAEEMPMKSNKRYEIVTARAVANLRILSELCIPLVKENGMFVAMKGSSGLEEKEEATKAIETLGCIWENEVVDSLNDGAKRVNLAYRKVKPTPKGYPRMYAKIKKSPL